MPVFRLSKELVFPPVHLAEDGLLAVGGDLSVERLLLAYSEGIFPWYSPGEPLMWWSPDPRLILTPESLRVSRRLRRTLRQGRFEVTLDTAFREVIAACAAAPREGQNGTWITRDMRAAYTALHEEGFAHSVECWQREQLVGGLYGICLGGCFFGESMFARVPDASKVALARLMAQLDAWGVRLVDCQVTTRHLLHMGGVEVARAEFLRRLGKALRQPTRRGKWRFDSG